MEPVRGGTAVAVRRTEQPRRRAPARVPPSSTPRRRAPLPRALPHERPTARAPPMMMRGYGRSAVRGEAMRKEGDDFEQRARPGRRPKRTPRAGPVGRHAAAGRHRHRRDRPHRLRDRELRPRERQLPALRLRSATRDRDRDLGRARVRARVLRRSALEASSVGSFVGTSDARTTTRSERSAARSCAGTGPRSRASARGCPGEAPGGRPRPARGSARPASPNGPPRKR